MPQLKFTDVDITPLRQDKTILLIDGDVMCHIACKDRWTWLQSQRKVPRHLWTFTPPKEGIEMTQGEATKYLQESWRHLEVHLKTLTEKLFITDYLIAIKSDLNFRDDLFPDYKAHRKNKPNANDSVQFLRDMWTSNDPNVIESTGREADDFLRIWAKEAAAIGRSFIIASIDKDLRCIEGKHYNLKTNEMDVVSPLAAKRLYYEQLLKGDPTDNIPGIPRVGDIKAAQIVEHCKTDEEYQEAVIEAYVLHYGEEWPAYLLANGKLIHLQENLDDYFSLESWPLAKMLRQVKEPELSLDVPKLEIKPKVIEKPAPELPKTIVDISKLKIF